MDRTSRTHFGMDERGLGGTYMIQQQFIHMFRVIQAAEKTVDNGPPKTSGYRRPFYSQCNDFWKRVQPAPNNVSSKVDSYPPESYFFLKTLPINQKAPAVYVPTKPRIQIGGKRPQSATDASPSPRKGGSITTVGGLLSSKGRADTAGATASSASALLSETTKSLIREHAPEKLIEYATSIDVRRYELDAELVKLGRRREMRQLRAIADVANAAVVIMNHGEGGGATHTTHGAGSAATGAFAAGGVDAFDPREFNSLRRTASIASSSGRTGDAGSPKRRGSVRFVATGPQLSAELLAIAAPKRLKDFKSPKKGGGGGGRQRSGSLTVNTSASAVYEPSEPDLLNDGSACGDDSYTEDPRARGAAPAACHPLQIQEPADDEGGLPRLSALVSPDEGEAAASVTSSILATTAGGGILLNPTMPSSRSASRQGDTTAAAAAATSTPFSHGGGGSGTLPPLQPLLPYTAEASAASQKPHRSTFDSPAVVGVVRQYEHGDDGAR